jgi:spore maturation protein CgeB
MLWQISHPELASPEVYERYDAVFVASDRFAELMAADVAVPVRPLHQATDPGRFHPQPGPAHEVLVVANWRADRRLIADLLPTDRRVAVYGRGWTVEHVGPGVVIGGPIANDELPRYYAGAAILLNDHAAGMRREGFMSNRLYDGAASGTLVVTDALDGVGPEFDGGVLVYRDREQLRSIVARYLADPTLRAATSWKARQAVLARHTFDHRVRVLLDAARPILAARVARDSP